MIHCAFLEDCDESLFETSIKETFPGWIGLIQKYITDSQILDLRIVRQSFAILKFCSEQFDELICDSEKSILEMSLFILRLNEANFDLANQAEYDFDEMY